MYNKGANPFAAQMLARKLKIQKNLESIKYKIAVMSGKGGVGKTTVTLNLAATLAQNSRVGVLDADIDCPNVNRFLGIHERFTMKGEKTIIPIEKAGLKVVSMASLQEKEDSAIMWRGPLIANTLAQFLENTDWEKLDYLFFDSPPGTSDVAMSLMQNVDLSGIIIVSTPQKVSIVDAKKTINMAKQFKVKILGLIENMSGEIFGENTVKKLAEETGETFLGAIKLNRQIAEAAEHGMLAIKKSSEAKNEFQEIAENLTKHI